MGLPYRSVEANMGFEASIEICFCLSILPTNKKAILCVLCPSTHRQAQGGEATRTTSSGSRAQSRDVSAVKWPNPYLRESA